MVFLAITLGITLFCIAAGVWGAETRPDFLDPRVKHQPGSVTAWLHGR